MKQETKIGTENCRLEYVDGELVCSHSHKIEENCLMKRSDEDEQNNIPLIDRSKSEFDEAEILRERMIDGEIEDALLAGC